MTTAMTTTDQGDEPRALPATTENGAVFAPATTKDIWTSLPSKTPKEKARILALMQSGETDSIKSKVNTRIQVRDVIAHRVTVENVNKETGEISSQPAVRVVLIDDEGNTYAASGRGVLDSLKTIAGYFGMPPWTEGMGVIPRAIETRAGRTTYILEPSVE